MAQQEDSLAVSPQAVVPSLPVEIALHRISRAKVSEREIYVPPGHWTEAYFQVPSKRERRRAAREQEADREEGAEREEESQSELSRLCREINRTATPSQSTPEPVVLYAESEAKSKKRDFKPSSPRLDSPTSPSYMKRMVDMVVKMETSATKMMRTEEDGIDWICGWIDSLSEKIIEHIRDAAEVFKNRESWSILAKVASGILAGISVVFGVSLLTTPAGGVLVGGLLIASGVLSIVNLILEETKVWDTVAEKIAGDDKKLRDQLKVWIPAGVGMLSMLVGSAGSIGAVFMGAFTMTHQMLMAGKTVAEIGKHISQMAEGVANSKMINAQAETQHMQTQVDLTDSSLKGALERLRQLGSMVNRACSSAHKIIAGSTKVAQMQEIQG